LPLELTVVLNGPDDHFLLFCKFGLFHFFFGPFFGPWNHDLARPVSDPLAFSLRFGLKA